MSRRSSAERRIYAVLLGDTLLELAANAGLSPERKVRRSGVARVVDRQEKTAATPADGRPFRAAGKRALG